MEATPTSALLAPLTLSGRRLRNRVAHTSMSTYMAKDGRTTERLVRYYANRAEGGAALIVTEPISMARRQTAWSRPRIYDDTQLDDFKRWADAVESHDCRLLGQIQDGGRARHEVGRTFTASVRRACPTTSAGRCRMRSSRARSGA